MSKLSRRKLITTGLAATAGASGLAVAARLARRYGLIPPDGGGLYGPGETLTYAAQRLLTRHSLAREFAPSQISKPPFANEVDPLGEEFKRLQEGAFADWRLAVDGMVARPASFSLAETQELSPAQPDHPSGLRRGLVLYRRMDRRASLSHPGRWWGRSPRPDTWSTVRFNPTGGRASTWPMPLHPQTLVAHGMNGGELPVAFGGPLRLRVPRQLGYKSVKYITRLTMTDSLKRFGKGLGSASPEGGYAWYAGI